MLDETIITETPPLYSCYCRRGEQACVPITGNRQKRILHGALNVMSGDALLFISREWVQELRATLPEPPSERRARLQADWGYTDLEMRDVVNAGAVELIEETIAAGAAPQAARKWWLSEISRRANEAGVDLADAGVTPAQVAEVQRLVEEKTINDKLARQVFDGLFAGEGSPTDIIAARGLALVSDDGPLIAAIEEALAAQPDIADKIRGGNHAAAGAIIGAVMKATRGQADAARVRELILERLG